MKRYLLPLFLLPMILFGQGIQVIEQRRLLTNEVMYLATAVRNITTYPLTESGRVAFKTAVASKQLSLTVHCPNGNASVYPAGSTLPAVAPCASYTTALLDARYTYNSATRSLDIEAAPGAGAGFQLKIEPVQGGILAMQSSASQPLQTNTYYPAGTLTGQGNYTQIWSFRATAVAGSGIPQLPYRITWKRVADNATFSYTFIPINATAKTLFTSAPVAGNSCDFVVGAGTVTPSVTCGASLTLTAIVSGTAATGLTYTWSGNGLSASGASVNATAPTANGNYTYTVSVAKTGCTAKTATVNIVVTGCTVGGTPNPPPGSTFAYEIPANQSWPSYNSTNLNGFTVGPVSIQESATVKMEIRKDYGGGIQIYDKGSGRAFFNFFDHGRGSDPTIYGGPNNYSVDAGTQWFNIGWNPITQGDQYNHGSPVDHYGVTSDGWIYTKTHLYSWPHNQRLLEAYCEMWTKLINDEVQKYVRITLDRQDQTFYEYKSQEMPCNMYSGQQNIAYWYNGNAPFSGTGNVTSSNLREGNPYASFQQTSFATTEGWQAIGINGTGKYCGLWVRNSYEFYNNVYIANEGNDQGEAVDATLYGTAKRNLVLDAKGTYYFEYAWKVANDVNTIRSWAVAKPHETVPNWNFTKVYGRNEWIPVKGTDQKEPFSVDGWEVTTFATTDNNFTTARQAKLVSPMRAFKAANFSTVYIKMAYTGSQTQLKLTWLLNGQSPDGFNSAFSVQNATRFPRGARDKLTQQVTIPVTGDGVVRTIAVNVGANANWKDIIQQFEIGYQDDVYTALPGGDKLKLLYFGTTNPN